MDWQEEILDGSGEKGLGLKVLESEYSREEKQSENGMHREVLRFGSRLLQVGFLLHQSPVMTANLQPLMCYLYRFLVANRTSCLSENTIAISLRVEFVRLALTGDVGSRHSIDCRFNSGTW
ncbi:hypothetical protein TNIN_407311 [Trichonephila inaurata madagascariensis]|uniref:Uncharacterized protein n=1 Tax=Trichonephila inaurata madagascariensis TaxID=2747483 RepID=A0A8X6M5Y5_9ARAC|nr:hypothetical protein TNIN_407311 [Trichonephila inaurata madagascariensis]